MSPCLKNRKKTPKLNELKDIPCSWIKKQYLKDGNVLQIDQQIQCKFQLDFLIENDKAHFKIYMELPSVSNSQNNLEEQN